MHISAWHEKGVHQGYPSYEVDPRLIQFKQLRWRPKTTQVRVHLGVQEQHALKTMPRLHTVSVLDVLCMDGNRISQSFQWNWPHIKIQPESMGIVETSGHPESIRLLLHRLLDCWPVYRIGAQRGHIQGVLGRPMERIFSRSFHIRVRVLLSLIFH